MMRKPSYEELEKRVRELEEEAASRRTEEEELRLSREGLAQIIQGSPIPTFVIDDKHVITHCNRAYEKLTGISASEVVGTRKQWRTFYYKKRPVLADFIVNGAPVEEIRSYYGEKFQDSAVVEGGYEVENFFPALGEKGKWLFFTAAPLRNAEGKITGAVETLQDVTERRLAEEALKKSERRLRTLLNFVPYPIVVFRLDGTVYYLNPAFTETFGWTFKELEGKYIPYTPPELKEETSEIIKKLFKEKLVLRHETKRLTKDGRLLDVVMRGAIVSEGEDEPAGELVILRDITHEKRISRINEAILRISMALPEYPDLEELLDYITSEVKRLLDSEGSLVILLDEEKEELFFLGAAYDDTATQERIKEIRFPLDKLVAGEVIKTGKPIIVPDTSVDPDLHLERDKKLGYKTRNLLLVPLRSSDRIIGVLCAINKKNDAYDQTDVELLSMIAGTAALSIENARFAEEIKKAYREVSSMNRAKDKIINHLSHELKTPVSVLSGSMNILARKLKDLPKSTWAPTIVRAQRNLDRIVEIQDVAADIVEDKDQTHQMLSLMFDQCVDELETLVAEQVGEGGTVEAIRKRIDDSFGPKKIFSEEINLGEYIRERLENLGPVFRRRQVRLSVHTEITPSIHIPRDPLQKIVDGLVKNAIENTPDEGQIEVRVQKAGAGSELVVQDWGVGISEEDQRRIFEGFFTTHNTLDYSSKRPFDFNAGGKGADLLRIKIFSQRYDFKVKINSTRCRYLPEGRKGCPGRISDCPFCREAVDCLHSGGTTFTLFFPPATP
jgi:PAS domain S-box-containing protein